MVIAWGLAVSLAIFAVGGISGAHLNPALTIAFAVKGDFPWNDVGGYIAAQFAGAFIGAVSYGCIFCRIGNVPMIRVPSLLCFARPRPFEIHFQT